MEKTKDILIAFILALIAFLVVSLIFNVGRVGYEVPVEKAEQYQCNK
jgi:hypothetical protein